MHADRLRESLVNRNLVPRHARCAVVRSVRSIRNTDAEQRQIVKKEGVQVIGVEDNQDVWPNGDEVIPDGGEELSRWMAGPIACHLRRQRWRVRHSDGGHQICHTACCT